MSYDDQKENRRKEIVERLIKDFGFIERKGWLRKGQCRECGKKELFVNIDNPWLIKCPRENKCRSGGSPWEESARNLYPDLFERFNERYKPTKEDPNKTANAYMYLQRGLDISKIKGMYKQGEYKNPQANKKTATVRFTIDATKKIYMDRFVETVYLTDDEGDTEERKQSCIGRYQGLVWQPPGQEIKDDDEVFIVEACIDALSLFINGYKVVANLNSGNYPDIFFASMPKGVTWVWALDNDKAGVRYIKQHSKTMREKGISCRAALPKPGAKQDWNELHKKGEITKKHMVEYFYQGDLIIAETPMKKALRIWSKTERNEFHFDFNHCWYWFNIDIEKLIKVIDSVDDQLPENERRKEAAKQAGVLTMLARCAVKFLYYQVTPEGNEGLYYARIDFPHDGRSIKNTFSGGQITNSGRFKERLASIAPGSIFMGKGYQLDRINSQALYGITTVDSVEFVGFSKEHGCYVFNDIAILNGRLYRLNEEDYFEMNKIKIKSVDHSVTLKISPTKKGYSEDWVHLIWKCYGAKGLAVLTFWFGSLFAEQIREKQESYPFLEVVGEAGAGKTTLLEFLWRLFGRSGFEGQDPNKSSPSARARYMGQISNLPCVFIEGDRETDNNSRMHVRQVNWDEFKTAYNGRATHSRGMQTHGNQTYEPPFKGALVISQNNPIVASEAIISRIFHIYLTRSGHNAETKIHAKELGNKSTEEVSHFLVRCLQDEKSILNIVNEKACVYENKIMDIGDVKMGRIAKIHGQMLALFEALSTVVTLTDEMKRATQEEIVTMATERQNSIAKDHPLVAEFWETLEYLNYEEKNKCRLGLNHSNDERLIAVNLNHYEKLAKEHNQRIPELAELRKNLATSCDRKLIGYKAIHSFVWKRTVKCYIFEAMNNDTLNFNETELLSRQKEAV